MWQRYVAIGDSTVEGLEDPHAAGGYRGWADRLAEHLAAAQGGVSYANLAIRGRKAFQVRREQLPVALGLEPDLVAVVAGVNDVIGSRYRQAELMANLEEIHAALLGASATVVTFTMPDPTPVMPASRPVRRKVLAFNDALRESTARSGVRLLDLAAYTVGSDPRLWARDRLHANSEGHRRIAAGLAQLLGLPGHDMGWATPLPVAPARGAMRVVAEEVAWAREHLLPWLIRRVRGRSAGDGVTAKRPGLEPVP